MARGGIDRGEDNRPCGLSGNDCIKKYEVISIEPTDLAYHWVITYRTANGFTDKQPVMAIDSNDAYIVFRNQIIKGAKAKEIARRRSLGYDK